MAAAITFDSDHTITVVEFTEGTPCTFEDIYDADVGGGWGIVTKAGTKTYGIAGSLVVGDGTNACYLTDTKVAVTWEYAWAADEFALHMRTGSVTQMGELLNGYGDLGCAWFFKNQGGGEWWLGNNGENGDFLFYGGFLQALATSGNNGRLYSRSGPTWDFTDSYVVGFGRAILYISPILTRTTFFRANNNFYSGVTTTDVTSINGGNDIRLSNQRVAFQVTNLICLPNPGSVAFANREECLMYFINPDSSSYNVTWGSDTDPANNINYVFTFNLNVLDVDGNAIESASVTVKDASGNNVAIVDSTANMNHSSFDSTQTNMNVTANTLENGDVIYVQGEFMLITAGGGTGTLTVTRAYYGTGYEGTSHSSTSDIYKVVDSLTTDASGDISEQLILYRKHRNDNGSETTTTFDPHTVTVTKAGYVSKTIKYTMDRKREEVETLEQEVSWISPEGKHILKNLDPTNSQNKYKWIKT